MGLAFFSFFYLLKADFALFLFDRLGLRRGLGLGLTNFLTKGVLARGGDEISALSWDWGLGVAGDLPSM